MSDQFTGKVLADKYRIDSLLSEGTLGNFYSGTHLSMEKPVAVKILAPALAVDEAIVNRFASEARTVSRISHPNILNVTDYGSDKDGTIFIVYDYATGETLKDLIGKDGQFSLERVNNIVRQAASALSVAHANGIVHQNLTSENILVRKSASGTEEIKVLNVGTIQPEGNLDELNSVQTPEYMAPEQLNGSGKIDERADIYSLGVIIYEMLTGELPFKGATPAEIVTKVQQPPAPLSVFRKDLPAEIDTVLLTALARNPDSRYQNINNLAESFNRAASFSAIPVAQGAVVDNAAIAAQDASQNNIWKTAFIVLAGVSLLSAFFIYSTQIKQTNPTTQMAPDANGQPVQPLSPSSGTTEQGLSNMSAYTPEMYGNMNSMTNGGGTVTIPPPGSTMPGGDGYDPWAGGGRPPMGAPTYVQPGGQQVFVDPNGSIFMPSDSGNTYIMVPKNANTASNVNTQPRRNANSNTNTAVTPPSANTATKPGATPAPAANTATPPKTTASPAAKTTPTPKAPAATEKRPAGTDKQE